MLCALYPSRRQTYCLTGTLLLKLQREWCTLHTRNNDVIKRESVCMCMYLSLCMYIDPPLKQPLVQPWVLP